MLTLHPHIIGEPDWRQLEVGDITTDLTQWYSKNTRQWAPVDWFESDSLATRFENNYRVPVTFRAKVAAVWAAKGKLFMHYVLRRPSYLAKARRS